MNLNNNNSIANTMRYQRAHFDETEDEGGGYHPSHPDPSSTLGHHPLDGYEGGNNSPLNNDSVPDFTRQPPPPLPPPLSAFAGQPNTLPHVSYEPNARWDDPSVVRPKDYSILNHDQERNPYETPRLSQGYHGPPGHNGGLSTNPPTKRWSSTVPKPRPRSLATKMPFLNSLLRVPLSFWGRRSRSERFLLTLLGLSLFTVLVLSILVRKHNLKLRSSGYDYDGIAGKRSPGGTDGFNTSEGSSKPGFLKSDDACMTPYCISISAKLLNSMNLSADPCQDFYEYSCGGWVRDNNIPDGQSSWNNFQALFQKNQYILKRILEKEDGAFETKAELKAKIYYDSCLDENDTIEALGAKPLLALLGRYGGWNISALKVPLKKEEAKNSTSSPKVPHLSLAQTESGKKMMNRLLPSGWDFQDRMERMSIDLDISLLFSIYVSDDDKNSSRNALYIDMGRTSLPKRDYYLNTSIAENGEIYRAYLKYMTSVGVLLATKIDQSARIRSLRAIRDPKSKGPILKKVNQSSVVTPAPLVPVEIVDDEDPETEFLGLVQVTMSNVLEFETRMANFTPPPETLRDGEKNYNRMTLKEMDEKFNFINWTQYLNSLFALVNITLAQDQPIVVRSVDYMANMTLLVKEYLSTPEKRTILNNYFLWHVTNRMIPYLSQDFRATLRPLSKALKGSAEGLVPWRACISDTNNIIGFPLGSMFVKETFQGQNKDMAERMINRIKEAFKNQLPTLDWMDEETIKVASEKADAIRNKIGFPEYLLKPKEMNEKFEGLEFEKDGYFENNLRQLKFYMIKGLERIKEAVDKTRWSLTPPMVNAYYLATGNEMVFPAGILQPPFYDSHFPKALNFGAMGFVVGHELTHGFDDQGRQFDKYGNLKSWWNNASIARFNERAECLEKQYSNYKIEQISINGKQTIGENIADNGGLKATFSAFQAFLAANPDAASRLPGLNMTDNQLFFLAFSQVWCSLDTKKSLYYEIMNDSHSPNKIRVIGTLANSVEFSKAFDCPLKSAMNPVDKCVVW